MGKSIQNLLVFILCVCLFGAICPFAMAEGETDDSVDNTLHITSVEEFLAFAEACRLDIYSQGLRVSLDADLDFSCVDYEPVPIFNGIFEGNGHTISGLFIDSNGSVQGLFRYLTEDAIVRNLTVEGEIHPQGSHSSIGGIAGSNAGQILHCRFEGAVSGGDNVGGIAGVNTITGVMEDCRVFGSVVGSHFVGGLVGENAGVIRECKNAANVNTTERQNEVDLDDITIDTITSTESSGTATDIGGVAGTSTGVIRDCSNRGDVGYQQMGYNIGGIVGTQKGYIYGCKNYGSINGRKEVGGIAGQMEPVILIEYTLDTLQILRQQLDGMAGVTNRASAHVQSGASAAGGQLDVLSGQVGEAARSVDKLLEDSGYAGGIPDPDTIHAIENTLASHMTGINVTLSKLATVTENTMYALSGDMQALSGQISAMGQTIDQAAETMGMTFQDVSDEDTADNYSGKLESCVNHGSVLADLNVGGITGAIALENDMNGFESILYSGEDSMNAENKFRAVILSCENRGDVTVYKQNGGGIAGMMAMGLARECVSMGTIDSEKADYLGGIAGISSGFIRNCYTCCSIYGDANVGGIAGTGTIVTDCRSLVALKGSEKVGGVLGLAEDPTFVQEKPSEEDSEQEEEAEEPILGNYYHSLERDIGAIDGISYSGFAEPLVQEDFMELENIPDEFSAVVVRFLWEDGTEESIPLVYGGKLKKDRIPEVPERAGFTAEWEGLDDTNLDRIVKDLSFKAVYTAKKETIQSDELRENDMPVMLVQGLFGVGQAIELNSTTDCPSLSLGEAWAESWEFSFPNGGEVTKLRYSIPPGSKEDAIRLMVRDESGQWQARSYTAEGSYLVFSVTEGDNAVCLINSPDLIMMLMVSVGAIAVVFLAFLLRSRLRRK